jgi:transposase
MATGFRIRLTPEQRDELHRRARARVIPPRVRDRLEMVRLSDLDWSVPRIAAYLGCHEQTARRAVKAFLAGGFEALPDQPRPGRPPTLTAAHLGAVEALLDAAAARGETWTAPRLAAWLAETQAVWSTSLPACGRASSAGSAPSAVSSTKPIPTSRNRRGPTWRF